MFAICAAEEGPAVEGMGVWNTIVRVDPAAGSQPLEKALRTLRPDLYLCPMHLVEPADPPCPVVSSIPDLLHEDLPEMFSEAELEARRRSYGAAVARADLILTLSEFSRSSILRRYAALEPRRVVAAYPGVDPVFEGGGAETREDFLLYPANFWPHKNHRRLLEALARLRASGLALPLVLSGDPASGMDSVVASASELGLDGQVSFVGRVSAEAFVSLLGRARALVFPSLYEGFGLPIVEAFCCDTPVLCSHTGSCPETAADAALLVDPRDTADLAAALKRIWTDAELREQLVDRGRRRRAELDWGRSLDRIREALLWTVRNPRPAPARPTPLRALGKALGFSV